MGGRRHQAAAVDAQALAGFDPARREDPALAHQGALARIAQVGRRHRPAMEAAVVAGAAHLGRRVGFEVGPDRIGAVAAGAQRGPAGRLERVHVDRVAGRVAEGVAPVDVGRVRQPGDRMRLLEGGDFLMEHADAADDARIVGLPGRQRQDLRAQRLHDQIEVFVPRGQVRRVARPADVDADAVDERVCGKRNRWGHGNGPLRRGGSGIFPAA